jgi:phosphoenolpyruvate-protein kinase (PTS system EI component)
MDINSLSGPFGGLIAMAYAMGAASGYAFCLRTMYKILKEQAAKDETAWQKRIENLEHQLADAQDQIRVLQERLMGGMERQAAQVRESSLHILSRGKLDDPDNFKE